MFRLFDGSDMMPDQDTIIGALRSVKDPELNLNIVDRVVMALRS